MVKTINRILYVIFAVGFIGNIAGFIFAPQYMYPIYKQVNSIFHDQKVEYNEEVHIIFNKMKRLLPPRYASSLKLKIVKEKQINAWVSADGTVVLSEGMIKFANKDKGEIAGVLGHEIAHWVLGHHYFPDNSDVKVFKSAWRENMADQLGLLLGRSAGYNSCNVANLWYRIVKNYGNTLYSGSHPTSGFRYLQIKKMCEVII